MKYLIRIGELMHVCLGTETCPLVVTNYFLLAFSSLLFHQCNEGIQAQQKVNLCPCVCERPGIGEMVFDGQFKGGNYYSTYWCVWR